MVWSRATEAGVSVSATCPPGPSLIAKRRSGSPPNSSDRRTGFGVRTRRPLVASASIRRACDGRTSSADAACFDRGLPGRRALARAIDRSSIQRPVHGFPQRATPCRGRGRSSPWASGGGPVATLIAGFVSPCASPAQGLFHACGEARFYGSIMPIAGIRIAPLCGFMVLSRSNSSVRRPHWPT